MSILGALFLNSSAARANPVGENVAAGSVTFDRTAPGVLSIRQTTDRAIINWQDFSIAAGDLTRFIQPGANAAALNRVLGGNPSSIYGTLQANGQLILLNPAGIIVGPSGRIDAKGFIASTLNVTDDDFMGRARLTLSGQSRAPVKNAGVLKAGNVYLVAREVENAGTIRASNAGLVGGTEVVMGDSGQGVAVLYGGSGVKVSNSGLIEAAMAELRAAGENPYALAIRNSGIIRATTVANEGGKIVLKADTGVTLSNGTLDASGVMGGEVQVLGTGVGLEGSAKVDVSGENGGGTALIGGDFQGKNPYVKNANRTVVERNARIGADATVNGNGGKVVVWSDDLTGYYGKISARGGAGGQGGTVEVSGKENLGFDGAVNVGFGGSILLDPLDLTIQTTGAHDATLSTSGLLRNATGADATTTTTISATAVAALTGDITLEAHQHLTISAPLTLANQTAGETVTFTAGGNLTISAAVNTDGGALVFTASQAAPFIDLASATLTIAAPVGDSNTGAISFSNTGTGGISLADNVTSSGTVTFTPATALTGPSTVAGVGVTFSSTINGAQALTINDNGTTTLNGIIGGTTALTSLTTDSAGTTAFGASATAVTTTGAQTYGDAVTLGANMTFTSSSSGNIFFNSTVDNAVTKTLAVTTAGVTKFGGAVGVGGGAALTSVTTDASGSTLIEGNITTSAAQTYSDDVVIGADVTLTTTGASGPVTFGKTVNADLAGNNRTLSIVSVSTNTFTGVVGGTQRLGTLTTDSGGLGLTRIGGGAVSATTQSYGEPVVLTAATTLNSGTAGTTVTFGTSATVNGAFALTINASGTTTIGAAIGGTAALTGLTTDAGGTTVLNANITSAAQTYGDAVVLGANTTLTSTSGVTFGSTLDGDIVDSRTLTVTAAGATTFMGTVGGTAILSSLTTDATGTTVITGNSLSATTLVIADAVTLGSGPSLETMTLSGTTVTLSGTINGPTSHAGKKSLIVNSGGTSTISGIIGGSVALASVTTDAPGTTVISSSITTSYVATGTGTQAYNDFVTVSGSPTLTASNTGGAATITFAKTVNGAATLTVNAAQGTTISSTVGATTQLTALAVSNTTSTLSLNGASVAATTQTYSGPVALGANTTLTGTTVTFGSAALVDGAYNLGITATTTTLGAKIGLTTALAQLTTSGATTLSGGITGGSTVRTTGLQTYGGAATLGAATTLTSTSSGAISFSSTIGGAFALIVNTQGTTSFGGAVSGVASITTDVGGGTTVNTTSISTTGLQNYGDTVTLSQNVTIASTSSGAISFAAINGAKTLTVNSAGTTTFAGIVGATPLTSVTTDSAGGTTINTTAITTTGLQLYGDAVTLSASPTLTSSGSGAITFSSTVNGVQALTVNTSGTTTFSGLVGGTGILTTVTTDSGGTTAFNAAGLVATPTIKTSGAQTYNDAVTLSAATVLLSTTSGNITLGSTVNGAQALTINTTGTTTFGGAVGGTTPLSSLVTDATGTTAVNTTTVRTTTTQTYNDAVTVGGNPTFTGTAISFETTLDADATSNNRQVTITGSGVTTFKGDVGGTGVLGALTTDSSGTLVLDGLTISATKVTFNDPVTLSSGAVTINPATTVTFGGTVGGGQDLTVTASGLTTFSGVVGGTAVGNLTVNGGGSTLLKANVTTVAGASQVYTDALTLGANVTLVTSGAGAVTFGSTLDADLSSNNRTIIVTNPNTTTFSGAVGGLEPLSSLTTSAANQVNGGSVRAGTISFNGGATTLGASTTLVGSTITLAAVTGGANDLTISGTGVTTLNGAVTGKNLTIDNGGSTTIANTITTSNGNQVYGDVINLSGSGGAFDSSTGNGNITFSNTVDGAVAFSTTAGTGTVTFGGLVGAGTALTSVTTTGASPITISGGGIKTSGDQTYNGNVTLAGNTTLTGTGGTSNPSFAGPGTPNVIGAGYDLTLNFAGTGADATVILGNKITGVRHLTTGGGGDTKLDNNTATIATAGRQVYNDNVILQAATTLDASDITLANTVDGGFALILNGTGSTTITGAIGSTVTTFTTQGGGSTTIGANITTTGAQTYTADTIVLGANVILDSGGALALGSVAGAGKDLTLQGAGAKSFAAAPAQVSGVRNLAVTGATTVNGGTITTTGTQTYSSAVTLAMAAQTFASTGTLANGNISFANTVDGAFGLTINTQGTGSFANTLGTAVTSLTTDAGGTTALNSATVTINGAITFNDAVELGAATVTVTSTPNSAVAFNSTINSSTGSNRNLVVATTGLTTFGGSIGLVDDLGTIQTTGAGALTLGAGTAITIATATTQDYSAETTGITLGANVTLVGTSLSIGSVPIVGNASRDLALDFSTAVTIVDATFADSGATRIQNLSFPDTAGTVTIGGTTQTTGTQSFSGPVALASATVLDSTGVGTAGNITFAATAGITGANTLQVLSDGVTTFNGVINGPTSILTDLSAVTASNAAEKTVIGANITTAGTITFNDDVEVSGALTFNSGGNNAIQFSRTLNGTSDLIITQGTATATFGGIVGGTTALTSLQTSGTGTVAIGGAGINTTGNQNYAGAVTPSANTKLASTGGAATLTLATGASKVAGSVDITMNFAGTGTALGASAAGVAATVGNLTTGGGGTTQIHGSITTAGRQTYNDIVDFITTAATLTATDITFASTVTANANAVTLTGSGTTTLNGNYTSTGALLTDGGGTTVLGKNAAITINTGAAAQTYEAVRLATDVTFTTSHGTGVTLVAVDGTSNGTEGMTFPAATKAVLSGVVGGTTGKALEFVNVNGTANIGANVTTTGDQTYTDAVTLAAGGTADPVLTGANLSIPAGVTVGNANDLTLNFSGTTTLVGGATFAGVAALVTGGGGTTTINGSTALSTTGAQTYNDAVVISANSTLTSSGNAAITFASTVNGAFTLAVNTTAVTRFDRDVGGTTPLVSVTTDAGAGATTLGTGATSIAITTSGAQNYGDTITLAANATLAGTTGDFAATAVSGGAGGFDLTLNFSGLVDSLGTTAAITANNLRHLTVGGGGTTTINGNITTTGKQTYNDAVITDGVIVLQSGGAGSNGNITFGSTLNSTTPASDTLTVNTAGTTTFGGSVGLGADGTFGAGDKQYLTLTTDATGGTTISGGTIFATTLDFNDTVTLGNGTVIKGTTTNFDAATAILGGSNSLTLSGTGVTLIGGNVSGVSSLVRDAGTTTLGASGGTTAISVTTTGAQVYTGTITLNQNTTLTGTSVTSFSSAIANNPGSNTNFGGSGKSLTVNITP